MYLVRERRRFWASRPSGWLLLSSALDVVAVSVMAGRGILMAPIAPALIAGLIALAVVYLVLVDSVKVHVFRCFGLR